MHKKMTKLQKTQTFLDDKDYLRFKSFFFKTKSRKIIFCFCCLLIIDISAVK